MSHTSSINLSTRLDNFILRTHSNDPLEKANASFAHSSFSLLTDELMLLTFTHLDQHTELSLVCKIFHRICHDKTFLKHYLSSDTLHHLHGISSPSTQLETARLKLLNEMKKLKIDNGFLKYGLFAEELSFFSYVELAIKVQSFFLLYHALPNPEVNVLNRCWESDSEKILTYKTLRRQFDEALKNPDSDLAKIEELASYEHLARLPDEIGQLSSLVQLRCWNSKLTSLPPSLAKLTALKTLNLDCDDKMHFFPAPICKLTTLECLSLHNSAFSELPDEIGDLQNLTTLSLSYGQLTSLPATVGLLQNLRTLLLNQNSLSIFPDVICTVVGLETLKLSHTALTNIPDSIAALQNLGELNISNNELALFPPAILELGNLFSLNFSSNQITSIPAELANLPKLQCLYTYGNPADIPPAILNRRWSELKVHRVMPAFYLH